MNDKIIQGWRAKVERDRLAKEEADKATCKPRIHVVTKRPKLDKKYNVSTRNTERITLSFPNDPCRY